MNEIPLTRTFDEAAEKCRKDYADFGVDYFLSGLRDAATALKESGQRVSLEVRPRRRGFSAAVADTEHVYANATLQVGDVVIDWAVARAKNYNIILAGLSDGVECLRLSGKHQPWDKEKWQPPSLRTESLKDDILEAIARVGCEPEILGAYDVGSPLRVAKPVVPGLRKDGDAP
jgi:hypothetical protein